MLIGNKLPSKLIRNTTPSLVMKVKRLIWYFLWYSLHKTHFCNCNSINMYQNGNFLYTNNVTISTLHYIHRWMLQLYSSNSKLNPNNSIFSYTVMQLAESTALTETDKYFVFTVWDTMEQWKYYICIKFALWSILKTIDFSVGRTHRI